MRPHNPAPRGLPLVIILAFVTVVLAAVGVGLLWWSATRTALAKDAPDFTLVQGTVLSLDFQRIRRSRGPEGLRHRLLATYSYEVNGQRHTNDVVAPLPPEFTSRDEGKAWLEACNVRVNGPVDVFYDPARPARSVLMRETDSSFAGQVQSFQVGGWVVLGVLGTLVGVFTLVPAARRRLIGR